jgi:hypothetical protein
MWNNDKGTYYISLGLACEFLLKVHSNYDWNCGESIIQSENGKNLVLYRIVDKINKW